MKKIYAADLKNLDAISEDIDAFCDEIGAGSADRFSINLCLDELFTNIVSYGYRGDSSKPVEIEIEKSGADSVRITVIDSAPEFNPLTDAASPDTDSPVEKREIGGLGIFFIRKYMDDVSYSRENGKNRLEMQKKLGTGKDLG